MQNNPQIYETQLKTAIKRLKELEASKDWKENGSNPCAMFKIEIQGKLAAKGISKVDFPMDKVIQFLQDPNTLLKINPMLVQNKVLTQELNKYTIKYTRYKGQWPVADRDFVNIVGSQRVSDSKIYIATTSCSYPHAEVSKVVRGEIYAGGYIIEAFDQNTSQITYISHSDPKGSLPGMLKNALAVKQGEIASKIGPAMQANS